MNYAKKNDTLPIVIAVVAIALIFAGIVWYEVKYPCTEYRTDTCTSTDCVRQTEAGTCVSYTTRTYPCKTCIRRKHLDPDPPSEAP